MSAQLIQINRNSLFEATFLYKDSNNVPINLSGLIDGAEFRIYDGDIDLYTASVVSGEIIMIPDEGRFDLLIPEADVNLLSFRKAEFQFRILWTAKGWQEIGEGDVILDE